MTVFWLKKDELFPVVLGKLKQVNIILDIGCGIRPQNFIKPSVQICCEPFDQYIEILQENVKNLYDRNYVIIKSTWTEAVNLFPPKSIDSVFLVDVIEHLEKEEALALLKATEAIVRHQIALFTPLGFLPQEHPNGKDAWGLDGGAWQEHQSGWEPTDFNDSWDIYVSKVFHTTDNKGTPFEHPYGALWAIKTMQFDNQKSQLITSKRQKIHILLDKTIDLLKTTS
jgi:hypothetical protein